MPRGTRGGRRLKATARGDGRMGGLLFLRVGAGYVFATVTGGACAGRRRVTTVLIPPPAPCLASPAVAKDEHQVV